MEQTILYHHLKNYIIPLSNNNDMLIAFRLDEKDIMVWQDGQITKLKFI